MTTERTLNPNTYAVALLNHARCLDLGGIARICCDNGVDPIWWCEVAYPTDGWVLAMQ